MDKVVVKSILSKSIENGKKIKLLDLKKEILQTVRKEKLEILYKLENV